MAEGFNPQQGHSSQGSKGPLSGIRVLELGQLVSAPYCARLFGDYGADVTKVELPAGDDARRMGPFPGRVPHPEKSGLFFINNLNKRGATCNVSVQRGRDLFLRLVATADVLIENNLPAQMREWGLDYATLEAVNPRLVMVSITPFGQTGPYGNWKGHDLNAYHLSGAGSRYCGRPDRMPLEQGTFSADYFGAVTGAAWGMAALIGRDLIGGQHVDVSSAEAIAATFVGGPTIAAAVEHGCLDTRTGFGNPLSAPATILPCKDGQVWIMVMETGQWQGLRVAMGDPSWAEPKLFEDSRFRAANQDLIYSMVTEWCQEHDKMEVMELCQANGCPASAILTVEEAVQQPHLKERGYFVDVEHAALGRVRVMGAPFKLLQGAPVSMRPAPLLGEDNETVWGEIGLSRAEIDDLRADGVL